MNLRHAAALALVGWYLIVSNDPQARSWAAKGPHGGAVLRDWTVSATFKTQRECEKTILQRKNAQCISFDPRLKSK